MSMWEWLSPFAGIIASWLAAVYPDVSHTYAAVDMARVLIGGGLIAFGSIGLVYIAGSNR